MRRITIAIATFLACIIFGSLNCNLAGAQTPVPSGDIDPAVWQPSDNSWVGGNPNGYTESETAAMAVRIKTDTTDSQSLSVCIEVLQVSSGSYGFNTFLPWNTTVAPTNLFGNGGSVGPAIVPTGSGNFQGHNLILDNVSDPALGGGGCPANYLGVAIVFHKVIGTDDGYVLYGGRFAQAGDPLPSGSPDSTVPAGQSAAFIDGVFQSRIEGGGDKTINFKGDLIALVPGILLEKTVTTADGTCPGQDTISVPLGSSVKFCFVITNTGQSDLIDVTLVDNTLGLDLTSSIVGLTSGDLPVGATATAEAIVQVNSTIQNTATASGSGTADDDVGTAAVYFCGDGDLNPGEQCDDGNTTNGDGCTSTCQCGVCGCGIAETDTDGDGTADCIDLCAEDPSKTEPGICGCGVADTDSDRDGVADCNDNCPQDPNKTDPGICGCGVADTDSDGDGVADCNDICLGAPDVDTDGDGVLDCLDECPLDPAKTVQGICPCGVPDTDSDGDGTSDCLDLCPEDATKTDPGVCGCGVPDVDTDGDRTLDCNDACPEDANKTEPGLCGCGTPDTNSDLDEPIVPDCLDGCPNDPNKTAPGVCGCGVLDIDTDGDGTFNCFDLCPDDDDKTTPGICGCGTADTDSDGDGTADCNDSCPQDGTKTAPGICGCGVADTDSDGDGVADCNDGCPQDPNKTQGPGICGCGVSDADTDNDGNADCNDPCPADPNKGGFDFDEFFDERQVPDISGPGICGCGVPDTDSDGDGVADCLDNCDNDANKTEPGVCGCGVADTDSDEDGTADCNDQCVNDSTKTAPGVCGCGVADTDSDGDGTADCNDLCSSDSGKTTPGICGCGVADTDSDGDGTANCNDQCINDGGKTTPGICGCGVSDIDSDNDGVADCNDLNCNDVNITDTQLALDGNSVAQKNVVHDALRGIYRRGSAKDKEFARALDAQAEGLYLQNWTLTYSLPGVQTVCQNVNFCVNVSNTSTIDTFNTNADALDNLTKQAVARLRKVTRNSKKGANFLKDSKARLAESLALSGSLPAFTSSCTTPDE